MNRRTFITGSLTFAAIAANIIVYTLRRIRNGVVGLPSETRGANEIGLLAFSTQGTRLVSLTPNGNFTVWDASTQNRLFAWSQNPSEKWTCLGYLTDDSLFATASNAGVVKFWIPETKSTSSFSTIDPHPTAMAFRQPPHGVSPTPISAAIAVGDNSIRIVEKSSSYFYTSLGQQQRFHPISQRQPGFQEIAKLEGHTAPISDLRFSANNSYLASGSTDRTVRIWNVHNWQRFGTLKQHDSPVTAIGFSVDNQLLVSGTANGTISIWALKKLALLKSLPAHKKPLSKVAFSADSAWIVSAASDGTTRLWSLKHELREGFTLPNNPGINNLIDISSDGKYLASSWGEDVRFWKMDLLIDEAKKNLS